MKLRGAEMLFIKVCRLITTFKANTKNGHSRPIHKKNV